MTEHLPEIEDLEFYPDLHRYRYKGQWLARSVTSVVGHDMTAKTREYIEATKDGPDGWLVRGNTCHQALESFLRGDDPADPGDFGAWIEPLLSHDLFKGAQVLAVEYRVCSPSKSLAGSMDFVLRTAKGAVVVGDLKTVSKPQAINSRKSATEQLGAYAAMLIDHHPTLTIDKCCTVVAGPGRTRLIPEEPSDCISAWIDCWHAYQLTQPPF
jgi:hypothetical protein